MNGENNQPGSGGVGRSRAACDWRTACVGFTARYRYFDIRIRHIERISSRPSHTPLLLLFPRPSSVTPPRSRYHLPAFRCRRAVQTLGLYQT